MSIQSLPVNRFLIMQVWHHIALDSGFSPTETISNEDLVLEGSGKWLSERVFVGKANVRIKFLGNPYQLFLNEMSVEFIPDHPKAMHDYRMLKGETLLAFYHQKLVPDLASKNRPGAFVATCPQRLVVLLARHNFVSSIDGYPVMFTSLEGKTIAE